MTPTEVVLDDINFGTPESARRRLQQARPWGPSPAPTFLQLTPSPSALLGSPLRTLGVDHLLMLPSVIQPVLSRVATPPPSVVKPPSTSPAENMLAPAMIAEAAEISFADSNADEVSTIGEQEEAAEEDEERSGLTTSMSSNPAANRVPALQRKTRWLWRRLTGKKFSPMVDTSKKQASAVPQSPIRLIPCHRAATLHRRSEVMEYNCHNGLQLSYFLERLGMTPKRTVSLVRPYFAEDTRRLARFTPSKWVGAAGRSGSGIGNGTGSTGSTGIGIGISAADATVPVPVEGCARVPGYPGSS